MGPVAMRPPPFLFGPMTPMSTRRSTEVPSQPFLPRHTVMVAGFLLLGAVLLALPFLRAPASAQAARADLETARTAISEGDAETAAERTESARTQVDDVHGAVQDPGAFTTLAFNRGRVAVGETIDGPSAPVTLKRRYWRKVQGNPFHRGRLQVALATFAPDGSVSGKELVNAWRAFRGRPMSDVTDASILGNIATDEAANLAPLEVLGSATSWAEAFRVLRTNMQYVEVDEEQKVIVMTSSLPGEGKSTTAINLALMTAMAGQRVVLVEADLRRPLIAERLQLDGAIGTTNVLIGKVSLDDALQEYKDSGLKVFACGPIPPNPSELLQSHGGPS